MIELSEEGEVNDEFIEREFALFDSILFLDDPLNLGGRDDLLDLGGLGDFGIYHCD